MAWTFQRGEDIAVPLAARGKTATDLAAFVVSASLKRAGPSNSVPPADAPIAATFVAERRDDLAGVGAGWLLSIPAAVSATLAPGTYVTNAAVAVPGGGVIKTDPLIIRIQAAT